jgi:hypothetical protein
VSSPEALISAADESAYASKALGKNTVTSFPLVVVFGLVVEYFPELTAACIARHRPEAGAMGGILVTLGVFAEVVIGVFIARASRRIKQRADFLVADARIKAADALKAAADANLLAVRGRRLGLRGRHLRRRRSL